MYHTPALLKETLQYLDPREGKSFIDCTLGGGGYTQALLEATKSNGRVLAIDLDEEAIEETELRIKNQELRNLVLVRDNFRNIKTIAHANGFEKVDGILYDLGVSSHQLDEKARGFGFDSASLDMRMDKNQDLTAAEIINHRSKSELIHIFKTYGEERLSAPIADAITRQRKKKSIISSGELSKIVAEQYFRFFKKPSFKNPATKIFQALRIAVNDELGNLEISLSDSIQLLRKDGRIAVISYHSLEDKIVKEFFKKESRNCLCAPQIPQCVCAHKASLKIITKKPIIPGNEEIARNPRARSAKLRVAQKI
ncbi:MAG: Ribosomal RNA small subunit methyltransferase H [Parcubacteria group bacterium GW2011_GWA2_38_13]|nr:MAG: Ribosomal RNA small subunit methyltransferase H [Parcubacteria group bacterium GW2011_GWA2_38_13]